MGRRAHIVSGMRRKLLAAILVGVALVLLSALVALAADTEDPSRAGLKPGASAAPGLAHALVTLSPGAPLAIPRSFLGISTEYWGLPEFERQMSVLERTLSLLRPDAGGPMVLRVG